MLTKATHVNYQIVSLNLKRRKLRPVLNVKLTKSWRTISRIASPRLFVRLFASHLIFKGPIGDYLDTASTLSMLPREMNGVVDPTLRVYGTKNIRVVDLSIAPLHVASHTQSKLRKLQFWNNKLNTTAHSDCICDWRTSSWYHKVGNLTLSRWICIRAYAAVRHEAIVLLCLNLVQDLRIKTNEYIINFILSHMIL